MCLPPHLPKHTQHRPSYALYEPHFLSLHSLIQQGKYQLRKIGLPHSTGPWARWQVSMFRARLAAWGACIKLTRTSCYLLMSYFLSNVSVRYTLDYCTFYTADLQCVLPGCHRSGSEVHTRKWFVHSLIAMTSLCWCLLAWEVVFLLVLCFVVCTVIVNPVVMSAWCKLVPKKDSD